MVIINRIWAMPNRWTFTIRPIALKLKELLAREIINSVDPFAGKTSPAKLTNDINPNMPTKYNLDALSFLQIMQKSGIMSNFVLYDPPYSFAEFKKCYEDVGLKADNRIFNKTYEMLCKNEISKMVMPGGIVCSFGWNSNGIGINRGFKLAEILLVAHGGSRNDTIMTIEVKQ